MSDEHELHELHNPWRGMMTIDVIRESPPALGHCRAEACGRPVEWVTTVTTGRRMPVDHPLDAVREFERDNGDGTRSRITVIDGGSSHFATCPSAKTFRRRS
jgi:hypothetical protein